MEMKASRRLKKKRSLSQVWMHNCSCRKMLTSSRCERGTQAACCGTQEWESKTTCLDVYACVVAVVGSAMGVQGR